MWPLWVFLRTYAPYVTFPAALVIGFIGYQVEHRIRDPDRDKDLVYLHKSVREERMMDDARKAKEAGQSVEEYTSLKEQKFPVPRYTFDENKSVDKAADEKKKQS